jgi:hypothetical protein
MCSQLIAQPTRFNYRYISPTTETASSICNFGNFSWIVGGGYSQNDEGSILLVKIDNEGNLIDHKELEKDYTYYFTGWVGFTKVTTDGAMIFGGAVVDTSNNVDFLLIKFDINGDTLWTKRYDFAANEGAYDVIETSDRGFAIIGSSEEDTVANTMVARIIKTDSIGNFEWTQTYAEDNLTLGSFIIQTPDKGYCVGGGTSYNNPPNIRYPYVFKTDSLGNLQWMNRYGSTLDSQGNASLTNTSDGNIAVATFYPEQIDGSGNPVSKLYVAKINISNGDTIWTKKYGKSIEIGQILFSIVELQDGSLVSVGTTFENGYQKQYGLMLKTASNGDSLWLRYFTAAGLPADSITNYLFHIQPTLDSGFVACGWVNYAYDGTNQDIWALKVDKYGCEVEGCQLVGIKEIEEDVKILVYPNPAQDFVSIGLPQNYNKVQLCVYNMTGQLVSQKQVIQSIQQIPIPELGNGMYIFVIQNEDRVIGRQRVVVAR